MKKAENLRKKYPFFRYERFGWWVTDDSFNARFRFRIGDSFEFNPEIEIKGGFKKPVEDAGKEAVNNFVFHLGLAEIPSYWKPTCSPNIRIEAGSLERSQLDWWKKLLIKGMGQFFYKNGIDFKGPQFLNLTSSSKKVGERYEKELYEKRSLVALGGGKDSVVSLEIGGKTGQEIICFGLNPEKPIRETGRIGGCQEFIPVKREMDPLLLKMNKEGFLNGHTPFSSYLAFLSSFLSLLTDSKYVVFSNERSANEENVEYLGEKINHQYSKSFEFEKDFSSYSRRWLAKDLCYFSLLRPLYELQIAKLFSKNKKYFSSFLSCNQGFRRAGGKNPPLTWCGKCAKCLSVFSLLYPFLEKDELLQIFGKNLFEDKSLLPLAKALLGEGEEKPWECVGTFEETRAAFYFSLKKEDEPPFLLRWFREEVLPKYENMEKVAEKVLSSWNGENNLPPNFKKALKNELRLS